MMLFRRFIFIIIGAVFYALSSFAEHVWSAADVPIPYLKDSTQYVADPDGLLSAACKDSANVYLRKLNLECGVQNVLIVVGKVYNHDAFRMAQDVGNKYGIGDKKSRRGLVVVISVDDHKYFIAPGMGLEGELTDVDCDDIARACIVKFMREGRIDDAIVSVSRAIYNKVKDGRTGIESVDEGSLDDEDWVIVAFLLLICFGIPAYLLVRYVLEELGIVKKKPRSRQHNKRHDDWMPPFFMGGGGFSTRNDSFGGGFSGGSFGGGSFGGGGSGGSW